MSRRRACPSTADYLRQRDHSSAIRCPKLATEVCGKCDVGESIAVFGRGSGGGFSMVILSERLPCVYGIAE
jgi:hypothetical protein